VRREGQSADAGVLAQMCDAIRHRGPDEEGSYVKDRIGLAMRRLAIIDIRGGQQPIHNEDRTAWIVFNGEIYNYQSLRASLERLGHKFYTATRKRLSTPTKNTARSARRIYAACSPLQSGTTAPENYFSARPCRQKPLLYTDTGNQLIFASEFSALLKHPDISREVNTEAIDKYLSFMCVPAPLTAFRGIKTRTGAHTALQARRHNRDQALLAAGLQYKASH
jgi:asparagine synthase (glutamine-hydrolysing)